MYQVNRQEIFQVESSIETSFNIKIDEIFLNRKRKWTMPSSTAKIVTSFKPKLNVGIDVLKNIPLKFCQGRFFRFLPDRGV